MKSVVKKRGLHEPKGSTAYWRKATVYQRLEAVDEINRLGERKYAEQAFPRIHRITRKARG
jgi:hypothetical protein